MPVVAGAYCGIEDLRFGDIAYPSYLGDKEQRIKSGAEEIDTAIGHIYVTPVVIPETIPLDHTRPSYLMLKKINWLITSGRMVLDMAAAGERDNLHAYGRSMLKEGIDMLTGIATGETQLPGIEQLPPAEGQVVFTGPAIFNEDPESLVEGFYQGRSLLDPFNFSQPTAYGHTRRYV
jgi:hypothetical protein